MNKELKHISKFLSLILRHKPETIGLELDSGGWANIEELIILTANTKQSLTRELIQSVVKENDKQRFAISLDGFDVRANQGHSFDVDLDLNVLEPPDILYHGTATKNMTSIMSKGLIKGNRNHVHLSTSVETAKSVGHRYGKPVVLIVESKAMFYDHHIFYRSQNGVWLTESVAPEYIRKEEND